MKNTFTHFILGSLFVVFGLLIAIGPQTIFEPCKELLEISTGGMEMRGMASAAPTYTPMKCHWSGVAEIGPGGAIALLGLLLLCFHKSQLRLGITFAQTLLGIMVILFPTKLIGVCMAKTMNCHLLFYPMMLVLGSLVIAASLVNGFFLIKGGHSEA